MFHSNKELFCHILDEIEFLEKESAQITEEQFLFDQKTQRAFARSIEVIGEAVKNLSLDLTERHPEIPWRNIAGMRNKLIHGYFSIDYKIVWDVVKNIIPAFKIQIKSIM